MCSQGGGGMRRLLRSTGLVVFGALVATACATSVDIATAPIDSGQSPGSTNLISAPAIRPHTCFTEADLGVDGAAPVSCRAPHIAEFFATMRRSEGPNVAWPGTEEVQRDASAYCNREFAELTGTPGEIAALDVMFFRPSEADWAEGDRDVACFVQYRQPVITRLVDTDPTRAHGLVSTFALATGDCVADPSLVEQVAVHVVECGDEHWFEIYASVEMPGTDHPGDEAVRAFADQICVGQFEEYVGVGREESDYTIERVFPTTESWHMWGDRLVSCALTTPEVRRGTARGSRR